MHLPKIETNREKISAVAISGYLNIRNIVKESKQAAKTCQVQ